MNVEDAPSKDFVSEDRGHVKTRRGAMRVKFWALGGLLLFFVIILFFPKNAIRRSWHLNYVYLAFFCAIAAATAIFVCRDMWRLNTKRIPRWIGITVSLAFAVAVLALLVVHDLKLFVWNHLYFEVPISIFLALVALGTWFTESRKSVQVFYKLEGFTFVSTDKPSNSGVQPIHASKRG